jgi:hypothetical protein
MKNLALSALAVGVLVGAPQAVSANTITIALTTEFSGADTPGGTSPYLTAIFDDFDGSGVVQLTLDATNLIGSEFVTEWDFNLNPALDATLLDIDFVGGIEADSVSTGTDAFKADGVGGFFDIEFMFPNAPPGDRLGPNLVTTSVYTFTLLGLEAEDFNYLSVLGQSYASAAKVQGIGPNGEGSGWIGGGIGDDSDDEPDVPEIPEPASFALLGFGGLLLVTRSFLRRRKR